METVEEIVIPETRDYKLEGVIRVLIEKLTQRGVDLTGKAIIIKEGKLTIEDYE